MTWLTLFGEKQCKYALLGEVVGSLHRWHTYEIAQQAGNDF